MNIICLKNHLLKALNLSSFQAGKNQNIPILQGGLFKTQKNQVLIETTNLESSLRVFIPAKTEKEGEIIVPIKILMNLISNLKDEKIKLEKKDNNLEILSQNSKTIIKSYPLEEFPSFPLINQGIKTNILIKDLISGLKSVTNSISKNETKPEISSIFIFNKENFLNFVATDSFRLSEKKVNFNEEQIFSFLIPSKHNQELIKILENQENPQETVEIIINPNQILFRGRDFEYLSVLTSGEFPEYKKLIPDSFVSEASLSLKDLIEAIRSSTIFSNRLNEIFLFLDKEKQNMEIKTVNADLGEYSAKFPARIKGESINLTFNCDYLLDGLENFKTDEILLKFAGETKPLLIASSQDPSLLYLIMPMKNY